MVGRRAFMTSALDLLCRIGVGGGGVAGWDVGAYGDDFPCGWVLERGC